MKRILITGAAGFIGSHLAEKCVRLGHEVTGFVRYNSNGVYPWLDSIYGAPNFRLVRGDVRDYDSLRRATEGCDTVLHLAALIGIPYSYESPLAYIRTNIEGTYNVLQAARASNCRNTVVTSTSEVYGSAQYVPIDEAHPAVAQSPYSATKIAADQLALSYFHSFGLPVKIVRPFNTYGPRQSSRAIVPTIVSQILAGRTSIRIGNVSPTRDLTYVSDTADGILSVAESDSCFGQPVNLGTGVEISIGDLAHLIAKLLGATVNIVVEPERTRPPASEVARLLSDNSLVRKLTGWRPNHTLPEGLQDTIEWMRHNRRFYDPQRYAT